VSVDGVRLHSVDWGGNGPPILFLINGGNGSAHTFDSFAPQFTQRFHVLGLTRRDGDGYRLDFIVEDAVIVEVKAVERLERVHSVQLLSYLRFANCPVGPLFNFHAGFLTRGGLRRVVNGLCE